MSRELEAYKKIVDFLGETLGKAFEAVLFDMTDPALPVAAAANSTGEHREAMRALIAEAAASRRVRERGYCANRPLQTGLGSMAKMSVLFIPDEAGEYVGALCLNVRCGAFMNLLNLASDMLNFDTTDLDDSWTEDADAGDAGRAPTLEMIDAVVKDMGVEPGRISQEERLEAILDLYDMGVFELKGAVARTADALEISAQSVYRYLAKIKRARS